MTAPATSSRRRSLVWAFITALFLVLIALLISGQLQRHAHRTSPIAAYLLPINETSRVRISWSLPRTLKLPTPLHADEAVSLPAGSQVRILHVETGKTEIVTGPTKFIGQQIRSTEPDALCSPLDDLLRLAPPPASPPTATTGIITSPVGVTRMLNPLLTWTTRDDQHYDVAVIDPADPLVPPRIAKNIRPPIALADLETPQRRQLAKDRNYEILLRETNASALLSTTRFLTTEDAQLTPPPLTTPADLLCEAAAAMARRPYRTGDVWLALSQLPPDWADSELALRLRLRVATELGLADEFQRALTAVARLR